MSWLVKVLLSLFLLVLLVAAGGYLYLHAAYPKVGPAPSIQIEPTEELLERGRYLAENVSVCIDCHSERDWNYFSGPIVPGTEGMGGEIFDESMGFPGRFVAKNITPAALSTWSDGEIARAITEGVSRDGRPFFPVMPYPAYRYMATEDVHALVAYLRTLKPIENQVPDSRANFPMNLILGTIPQAAEPGPIPPKEDTPAYGRYLTTIAACADCHTQRIQGEPVEGMDYAGGFEFSMPWGTVRSTNITPDKETGIGNWRREIFIARFKRFEGDAVYRMPVSEGEFNTVMPWSMYAGMTREDLGAIFDYLMTVEPVRHKVEIFTPAEATE